MTITTNRGQTFNVNWAWATSDGRLMIELPDTRSIEEIAQDFDGLVKIERKSEYEGDATYIGYDMLTSVVMDSEKRTALLVLRKGVNSDG